MAERGGTHEQHVEAGSQSHKNTGDNDQASSNRGGTHDQHVEAGRKGGEAAHGGSQDSGSSTRGGSSEQHAEAGRQSHKNS